MNENWVQHFEKKTILTLRDFGNLCSYEENMSAAKRCFLQWHSTLPGKQGTGGEERQCCSPSSRAGEARTDCKLRETQDDQQFLTLGCTLPLLQQAGAVYVKLTHGCTGAQRN